MFNKCFIFISLFWHLAPPYKPLPNSPQIAEQYSLLNFGGRSSTRESSVSLALLISQVIHPFAPFQILLRKQINERSIYQKSYWYQTFFNRHQLTIHLSQLGDDIRGRHRIRIISHAKEFC